MGIDSIGKSKGADSLNFLSCAWRNKRVQSLAGGRTLVSFGTAGRVEEYDASDRVVWHIDGNPGYVFRAQRIRSLYAPGVGATP